MTEMTKDVLIAACKAHGGYAAPRLNDQIFLQCRGFLSIKNLEDYINLKVLWLEQNAIEELTGLSTLQELVSLFVQNNIIKSLHHLSTLKNLRILNVSHNYLTSLDGLASACPLLETLQASHNYLTSLNHCTDLFAIQETLTSVDISFNKIEVGEGDMGPEDFFARLVRVSVIYFHGNPAARALRGYRRAMIVRLPQLTYLDERPVFSAERRVAEAAAAGGEAAEAEAREAIRREKREHLDGCVRVLADRMEANRDVRDRLTRAWEARRDAELRRREAQRREALEERQATAAEEADGRAEIAAAEAEEYGAAMEAAEKAREEEKKKEEEREKEKEKEEEKEEETVDVSRGTQPKAVPTDEEMLDEAADNIRRILEPVGGGTVSRTALKMEKAIGTVAGKLGTGKTRIDVWKQFAQWEAHSKC